MRQIRCFSIYYDDSQLPVDYIPFKNEAKEKTWRFEWNAHFEIINNHIEGIDRNDFLGLFSWKFREKTGISPTRVFSKVNDSAQVWNCSPDLGNKIAGRWNFMDWSEEGHKGIKKLIHSCCDHVGITYENQPEHVFYANQFLTTKSLYLEYIHNVVSPSLELLETGLWHYANMPSGYTRGLPAEELKKHTGLEHYNFIPFVLERMFMQFVNQYKLTVKRV